VLRRRLIIRHWQHSLIHLTTDNDVIATEQFKPGEQWTTLSDGVGNAVNEKLQ
jgi:hypothetical protein